MKKEWIIYSISVLLGCCILLLALWLFRPLSLLQTTIFSPLPVFLNYATNGQVSTLDLWTPSQSARSPSRELSDLSATSAISYDLTTEKVLFTKSPTKRLPMASLTKIMTAIVALEHPVTDDKYLVRDRDLVGEDSMGLDAGEILSKEELLYGLMLHSGNDAAEVFADNFSGGRVAFTHAMNEKAVALGLKDTHFTNPTGLEGDGDQYTTAGDLLVMTRYALQNFPLFAKVSATFDYSIPRTSTHKEYDLENETNLISSYPGVKGVKTGYTPEAGLCLVTYLDYGGHQIIAVLLNSENRRQEMKDVLDFSLRSLKVTPPAHT